MAVTYGARTQLAQDSNLNSLANSQAKALGKIDLSAGVNDLHIFFQATLAGSGISSTGTIEIYWSGSQDDATYTDGIAPTGSGDVAASLKNSTLLAVLRADVNSQVVRRNIDVGSRLGSLPKFGTVVAVNKSGAALAASGNSCHFQTIVYS